MMCNQLKMSWIYSLLTNNNVFSKLVNPLESTTKEITSDLMKTKKVIIPKLEPHIKREKERQVKIIFWLVKYYLALMWITILSLDAHDTH